MNQPKNNESWTACPPGRFEEAANQFALRRQRRQFLKQSVVGLTLLGSAGLGWMLYRQMAGNRISCEQAQAYIKLWTKLQGPDRDLLLAHTRICPKCQLIFQQQGLSA